MGAKTWVIEVSARSGRTPVRLRRIKGLSASVGRRSDQPCFLVDGQNPARPCWSRLDLSWRCERVSSWTIPAGHVKGAFGRDGSAFLEPAVFGRRGNRGMVLEERVAEGPGSAVYSGGKEPPLREPAFCGVREDEGRSSGL